MGSVTSKPALLPNREALFRGLLSRDSQEGDPEKLSGGREATGPAPRKSSARDCLPQEAHLFIEPSSLCSVMQSSMSEKPEGLFELQ